MALWRGWARGRAKGTHSTVVLPSLFVFALAWRIIRARGYQNEAQHSGREKARPDWDFSGAWRTQDPALQTPQAEHSLRHAVRGKGRFILPADINVVLVGFDGLGGYNYKVDAAAMQQFLQSRFPTCTPSVMQTGRSTFLEHRLIYNVVHASNATLTMLEDAVRANMEPAREEPRVPTPSSVQTDNTAGVPQKVKVYEVEATSVETAFDSVYLDASRKHDAGTSPFSTSDSAIIIVNFDKLRMDPHKAANAGPAAGRQHMSGRVSNLSPEELERQEGNYQYRYRYSGLGGSMTWIAKERYIVIDVSAGPVFFGPIGPSSSGAVTPLSVPRLQDVLKRSLGPADKHPSEAHAGASTVRDTIYRGELSSIVYSAIKHVMIPDMLASVGSMEEGRRLLMPVISLRDHADFDPVGGGRQEAPYLAERWGPRRLVDLQAVREVAESMLYGRQKLIMPVGSLWLHEHKALATAIAKATRTAQDDPDLSGGAKLDGEALLGEFRSAADMLTLGLIQEDGALTAEDVLHLGKSMHEQLRDGRTREKALRETQIVPVFLISLKGAPPGFSMKDGGFVAASEGLIIVLQVLGKPTPLPHWENGEPVAADGLDATQHIVAGVAAALGGVNMPHLRYSQWHGAACADWLWSVGHHPFGPYANTSGISSLLLDASRRNTVLSRLSRAAEDVSEVLESMASFAEVYMSSVSIPGMAGFVERDNMAEWTKQDQLPWLDAMYRDPSKEDPPLPHNFIEDVETRLNEIEDMFEQVTGEMEQHNYAGAAKHSEATTFLAGSRRRARHVMVLMRLRRIARRHVLL
eukprot:jgi/Tetstr1/428596/TSEL_018588.t1